MCKKKIWEGIKFFGRSEYLNRKGVIIMSMVYKVVLFLR